MEFSADDDARPTASNSRFQHYLQEAAAATKIGFLCQRKRKSWLSERPLTQTLNSWLLLCLRLRRNFKTVKVAVNGSDFGFSTIAQRELTRRCVKLSGSDSRSILHGNKTEKRTKRLFSAREKKTSGSQSKELLGLSRSLCLRPVSGWLEVVKHVDAGSQYRTRIFCAAQLAGEPIFFFLHSPLTREARSKKAKPRR